MSDLTKCAFCGLMADEVRLGGCWECASRGEECAAKRTVLQHLRKMLTNIIARRWQYAYFDLTWAWQRLTRTGDYRAGGYFDSSGYEWRRA